VQACRSRQYSLYFSFSFSFELSSVNFSSFICCSCLSVES
jgi:hypothetical protein